MTRVRSFSVLLAVAVLALVTIPHGSANAMTCKVSINLIKGGFIVGAAGGNGTMTCGGKTYQLQLGGIKAGLVIGGSITKLTGEVRNLNKVQDVEGTYVGAGAGAAVVGGLKGIAIRNEKGVRMALAGPEVGLMADLDLSGTVVRLKR